MSKKSTKQAITINCDSPEVYNVLVAILTQAQGELSQQIKNTLRQSGIESDPTFGIQSDGSFKASKKSYDKGQVIVANGQSIVVVKPYKELEKGTVYTVPTSGQFSVFVKTGTGIDTYLGHFPNWGALCQDLYTVEAPKPTKAPETPEAEQRPVMELS